MRDFICEHGNPVRPRSRFTVDQCRVCWLKARLTGSSPKPRIQITELATRRSKCREARMAGLPCPEEQAVISQRRYTVTWEYGLTTVPERRRDLLPHTLASLRSAGFDSPRIFLDDATLAIGLQYEQEFGLPVTVRNPRIRTHGNWILALYELFIRNPAAERFAIFQDDFITYPGLRDYLDKCPYPETGYWNLYTFPSNQQLCPKDPRTGKDKVGWYISNQFGRGAVALVFSRQAVITLLSAQHMVERPIDPNRGWKCVDGGIVDSFRKAGWQEWVHNPSLTQHLGEVSTTVEGKPKQLQAVSWRGIEYNALDLLKEK